MDLPVGQNLQDHVIVLAGPFTVKKGLTFILDKEKDISNVVKFYLTGTGPLSSSGVEAHGLFLSNHSAQIHNPKKSRIWPDIQLMLLGISLHERGPQVISGLFNLREDVGEEFYRPVAGKDSFHIMSMVSRPKSRGQIQLASKDPWVAPLIDPNYLDHPDDVKVMLEGKISIAYCIYVYICLPYHKSQNNNGHRHNSRNNKSHKNTHGLLIAWIHFKL